MGICTDMESWHRIRMARQREARAAQRGETMPLMYSKEREKQYKDTANAERRRVQYLCDQVQVAVAERKPQSTINKLLNELSQATGRPRMAL